MIESITKNGTIILAILVRNEDNQRSIIRHGDIKTISRAFVTFPENIKIQVCGCAVVTDLTANNEEFKHIMKIIDSCGELII